MAFLGYYSSFEQIGFVQAAYQKPLSHDVKARISDLVNIVAENVLKDKSNCTNNKIWNKKLIALEEFVNSEGKQAEVNKTLLSPLRSVSASSELIDVLKNYRANLDAITRKIDDCQTSYIAKLKKINSHEDAIAIKEILFKIGQLNSLILSKKSEFDAEIRSLLA